jgi:hypothetical protein
MKNITLSVDESLIQEARAQARADKSTLNEQFRLWLASYARKKRSVDAAIALINDMRQYVNTNGQTFTRDERNERSKSHLLCT